MDRTGAGAASVRMAWRAITIGLAALVLAGCAMHATKPNAGDYARLMQQAQTSRASNNLQDAKKYYHDAANADPTQDTPWYELAKIEFGQSNYGLSIVDAHEAIRRNPGNTDAQSILTISGLRVAVKALGNLHDETDPDGPAHQEALQLAAKMRHVLGQQVLVPPAADDKARRPRTHRVRRRRHKPSPKPVAPQPKTSATKTYSNPFGALPGHGG